jgi:hypothetical protein
VGFQARNKEYGAYLLRQNCPKHFFMSFCASLLLAIMVLGCPVYTEILIGKTNMVTKTKKVHVHNFVCETPPPNFSFLPPTPPTLPEITTVVGLPPEPAEEDIEEMPQQLPQATEIKNDDIICSLFVQPQFKGGQKALVSRSLRIVFTK